MKKISGENISIERVTFRNGGTEIIRTEQKVMQALYDAECKKVLSNRFILGWIMKGIVEEYNDTDVEQIARSYIEGTQGINDVIIPPSGVPDIIGRNTESNELKEGRRTYDILFDALIPVSNRKIIVDVEAQNEYHPNYTLESRAVYHVSRMISAQYGTEFIGSEFDEIKKSYSVWICTDSPKVERNSISKIGLSRSLIAGEQIDRKESYDKIEIVKICLGDEKDDNYYGVIKLLDILFLSDMDAEDKKKILREEYRIPIDDDFGKEVETMCNFSDALVARSMERGLEQGTITTSLKFYYRGLVTKQEVMEELSIDEATFDEYLREYPKGELFS